MANTLLGYFKTAISNKCSSTKYFNRQFLAVFISEYNAAKRTGINDFTETQKTDFYNKNGGAYCVFLEEWNIYKNAMEKLAAAWG